MPENIPVRYCSVHHGQTLFPDLVRILPEHRTLHAITRRLLCQTVAITGRPCDPRRCVHALNKAVPSMLRSDHRTGTWGAILKTTYREQYTDFGRNDHQIDVSPEWAAELADLLT